VHTQLAALVAQLVVLLVHTQLADQAVVKVVAHIVLVVIQEQEQAFHVIPLLHFLVHGQLQHLHLLASPLDLVIGFPFSVTQKMQLGKLAKILKKSITFLWSFFARKSSGTKK